MNLVNGIGHHGYLVTALALFVAACGLPLPLSVVLLTAGAAAHGGSLNLAVLILCAGLAGLCGDTLMYYGGRPDGMVAAGWVVPREYESRYVHLRVGAVVSISAGPKTLLFAKFVPGLATVAAPLAGSLNMRLPRFLKLDSCGVLLYVAAWSGMGFVFAPLLRDIIRGLERLGHVTAALTVVVVTAYVVWLVTSWLRDTKFSSVERVAARDLFETMRTSTHDRLVIIADVRSHGYYDPGMQRIKNSIRVEPSRLKEELVALREFMQPECEIYLYCSCAREATSVRVAKMLAEENCNTKVIHGGMRAWVKAGGPLEAVPAGDIEHLPRFE